jgi:hypothetical protein
MSAWWDTRDPESEADRADLSRQCYQLKLKGSDDFQIAEELGINPAEVVMWAKTGEKNAPVEDTDRDLEIARINAWTKRLEDIWEGLVANGSYGDEQKAEWIHKFISSFDKLSKGRRALGGLDKPSKIITSKEAGDMETVDEAVQRLAVELGIND